MLSPPTIRTSAVGDDLVQTVDARELHTFLEIGRDFTTWIRSRIAKFGFLVGTDFTVVEAAPPIGGAGNRGARTDYFLTLDMAKELSMVENNDQGRAARRHFIAAEKKLRTIEAITAPPAAAGESLADRMRLVAEARRSHGLQAARELWFRLGLPIVPAMRAAPAQSEMAFDMVSVPVGGHA